MNASFLALFVVAVLIVAEGRVDSDLTDPLETWVTPRSPIDDKALVTTARLLRSDEVDPHLDEERVHPPGISTIAEKLSSTKKRLENKLLLSLIKDPFDSFRALGLRSSAVTVDNPVFIQWMKHMEDLARKKTWYYSDGGLEFSVLAVLRATNSDDDLVKLFEAIRKLPEKKKFVDTIEFLLFENSAASHKLLNEAWLKSNHMPDDVFRLLRIGGTELETADSKVLQWLRFAEQYKVKTNGEYSDLHAYTFLVKEKPFLLDSSLALLSQKLVQTPDLKKVGENWQTYLLQKWKARHEKPNWVVSEMASPWGNKVLTLPKDDGRYRLFEMYTVNYAADRGGQPAMKTVEELFAKNKPQDALETAMKF